jgi:hypothetical protein
MLRSIAFTSFCLLFVGVSFAQDQYILKKDLRTDWTTFDGKTYLPVIAPTSETVESIHFVATLNSSTGDFIRIDYPGTYHLFVDGRIVNRQGETVMLSIDSLRNAGHSQSVMLTLYSRTLELDKLETAIVRKVPPPNQSLSTDRPSTVFKDFVITAGLVLLVFFVIMLRMHPKLVVEYLLVGRIFSFREVEDNQGHARFTLSSNVAFYLFFSLLLSLFLLIVFRYLPEEYTLSLIGAPSRFAIFLWSWIKIAAVVFVLLFAKLLVIYSLSFLFGMKSIAGTHFFNLMRLLVVILGIICTIAFVYLISRGDNGQVYLILLCVFIGALILWNVIVFLKLNNKVDHSMFHLFSYICATEVIPLLITIKVLFQ